MIRRTLSRMDAAGWPWVVLLLFAVGIAEPLVDLVVMP